MDAIAEPPSSMTQTAADIVARHSEQPAFNAADDAAAAFEKAFPNGVPDAKEVRAPGEAKQEPAPAKETEQPPEIKSLIPDEALKPKKEAAAPEVDTELVEQTKGMSEKASANFKKIHARATAAENRLKQMEAEMAKKVSSPADPDEVKQWKAKHDELDAIVKKTALEQHPGFKAQYDGEIDKQMKLAKAIAGDKHAKIIAKIIDGDDEKWPEIEEAVGSFKAQQLAAIATKIQQTRLEKAEQLDKWDANYKALSKYQAAEDQKKQEEHLQAINTAVNKVISKVQDEVEIFRKVEGNDEWNQEVDSRLGQIKKWATSELSPQERADLAYRAASAEKYRQLFLGTIEHVRLLQSQLAKFRGSQPNIGGSAEPANQGSIPSDLSYIDAATQRLTEAGALRTS